MGFDGFSCCQIYGLKKGEIKQAATLQAATPPRPALHPHITQWIFVSLSRITSAVDRREDVNNSNTLQVNILSTMEGAGLGPCPAVIFALCIMAARLFCYMWYVSTKSKSTALTYS